MTAKKPAICRTCMYYNDERVSRGETSDCVRWDHCATRTRVIRSALKFSSVADDKKKTSRLPSGESGFGHLQWCDELGVGDLDGGVRAELARSTGSTLCWRTISPPRTTPTHPTIHALLRGTAVASLDTIIISLCVEEMNTLQDKTTGRRQLG